MTGGQHTEDRADLILILLASAFKPVSTLRSATCVLPPHPAALLTTLHVA